MKSGPVEHIEITPGVCGGRPRIVGHRIRVLDVVVLHEAMGLTPDEIASQLVGITLADVYAALSYYHDHREEVRADLEAEDRVLEHVQRTHVSKLAQKLIRAHDGPTKPQ